MSTTAVSWSTRTEASTEVTAAARRRVERAPDLVGTWDLLASVSQVQGRLDDALAAVARGRALDPNDLRLLSQQGRLLMMARRWEAADSFVQALRRSGPAHAQALALDLAATLAWERGRLRAVVATVDTLDRVDPGGLRLLSGYALAWMDQPSRALGRFSAAPPEAPRRAASLRAQPLLGDLARTFSWHRALEADALAESLGPGRLAEIADSIERLAGLSYYGRDWRLARHVRGLLYARAGRHREAAQAFRAARWEFLGWNRSPVEEARAHLALGQPGDAIDALRAAYRTPLDAMGRYQPRAEIDLLMSQAFRAAGRPDSAAAYEGWARTAWVGADPEVRRRLSPPIEPGPASPGA